MKEDFDQNDSPALGTVDRRALLMGSGAALAGLVGFASVRHMMLAKSPVFIASGQSYQGRLQRTIDEGLRATGLDPTTLRGKNVLLKPNLVEPSEDAPHVTTHPAVVVAAAEVFRRWGANVGVGEAPGHMRDTQHALIESGMYEALRAAKIRFEDLNYQEACFLPNAGGVSKLPGIYFPRAVCEADLVVSMPKMKTHHWVGITAATKNLYGTLPGIKYGWPKNVLHHAGIPATVHDIHATLPKTIAIVDGITCMEGDGPIMGSPKEMGLLVMGTCPTAVDATCARLMGVRPEKIPYLALAAGRLGPLAESRIEQRGAGWRDLRSPFKILDRPHLRPLATEPGVFVS